MEKKGIHKEVFFLESDGLRLRIFTALPVEGRRPFPCVQIHHAGGGYEPIYEHMAVELAGHGIAGITMIHRGYPGSQGRMEYGKGEIVDIGNLTREMQARSDIDPDRMGIMGYSRGAHNALLAVERYDFFRAAALWSTPVDMADNVRVNPWISEIIGGLPEEIPEEYRIRSSILFTEEIDCPLLLIHGERDAVVPVRHTLRLVEALIKQGIPYELHLFAGEDHIWSLAGFERNWNLTVDFFKRHLLNSV